MFGSMGFGSFRGIGMIVLQILRILTVIGLTAADVSCWALVIHVEQNAAYYIFEAASLIFISFICTFLVFSEFPMIKWVRNWYRARWPLFSDHHGPGWLGVAIMIIGFNLLGKLNQSSFDSSKVGMPIWQLVLASGILNVTFGALNVFCGLVCVDRKDGINARDVRSKGSLAEAHSQNIPDHYSRDGSPASSIRDEKRRTKFMSQLWHKTPSGGKRFSRPIISGPFPAHQDVEHQGGQHEDDHHDLEADRQSPILPGVQRPASALHPLFSSDRSSRYSTATTARFR